MKSFYKLTPTGKARRLHRLALNALSHYDLDVADLRLITLETNAIFRIRTFTGDKWILRVTSPEGGHTADHITAEVDWLSALARETKMQVPKPLPAHCGDLMIKASAAGVPESRFCVIFSWLPGDNLSAHLTLHNVSLLGELSARLHKHALTYHPPANLELLIYNQPCPFPEPLLLFDVPSTSLFSGAQQYLFNHWFERIQNALDWLASRGGPMRIIHGDLHQWNVRYFRGLLTPFDFEDLMWGWPVQDIATSLYYFIDRPDFPEMRSAFEEGYRKVCPWPEHYYGEINTFIASRGIGLLNLVLNYGDRWRIDPQKFALRIEGRLQQLTAP